MFLAWFEILNWVGPLLLAKIVIYDQARVNGGCNYDYPGQSWVRKASSLYYYCLFSIGPNDTGYSLFMMKVFN